jgi:hypothetical protein
MPQPPISSALLAAACGLALSACGGSAPGASTDAPANLASHLGPSNARGLPLRETDAAGAARVVTSAIDLLMVGRLEQMALLIQPGETTSKKIDSLDIAYARHPKAHAEVGMPGAMEGAAGTLYIEVPVTIYPEGASGAAAPLAAMVTLSRANDVPGSSAEERSWRIVDATVEKPPQGPS